jgi:hypothetical protein
LSNLTIGLANNTVCASYDRPADLLQAKDLQQDSQLQNLTIAVASQALPETVCILIKYFFILKVFASYWNDRLFDINVTFISNVTSASSISVGSSFPYDHIIFPFCARVDQDIEIINSELETAVFSSLKSVGDDIVIESNPLFSAAYFPELLSIPGDLYIANNFQFLSANFMRVTHIDGSLSLINNNLLTSVVLNALAAIVGQLVYSNNPQMTGVLAPMLVSYSGRAYASAVIGGQCESCQSSLCYTMFIDTLSCSVIVGGRVIAGSSATSLVNPVLTRAEGFLDIFGNNMLTRIDFPYMSSVRDYLNIRSNSALTLASLPRLSQVPYSINICANAPSFVIPNPASGTAAPPGLTSVVYKGSTTSFCYFQNGSTACAQSTCP